MAQTLGETKDDPATLAARMAQLTAAHNIERDALLQSQADEAAKAQAQIKDAYAKLAVRQVQDVAPVSAPPAAGGGNNGETDGGQGPAGNEGSGTASTAAGTAAEGGSTSDASNGGPL